MYEQIAVAISINPSQILFAEDFPDFFERGHSAKEFKSWVQYLHLAYDILQNGQGGINDKKDYAVALINFLREPSEENHTVYQEMADKVQLLEPSQIAYDVSENLIPEYHLYHEELQLIRDAEKYGRGEHGLMLNYTDFNCATGLFEQKDVVSYDYRKIPANEAGRPDIFVCFSGHHETGIKMVEGFYHYFKAHGKLPEGIMFLGLTDNQGLTFWNDAFKFRKSSEYRMYLRHALALGIPKGLLRKFLMTPKDTSTSDNSILIVDTMKKYALDDVNLIMFGYPLYQKRMACQIPFEVSKIIDAPSAWFRIASIPTKEYDTIESIAYYNPEADNAAIEDLKYRYLRILSYDRLTKQLADLSFGNCIAHLFRKHDEERFALPGTENGIADYPEKFKPLLPLFLGYSYANVANEICGTDETVANMLKIARTVMLHQHDEGLFGAAQDKEQEEYNQYMGKWLVKNGFTTPELIRKGKYMEEDQFIKTLTEFYQTEA